jgi:hypothetical protein
MAAYEALRDSFREFNRLMIDSQQWDDKHELNKMQEQRQDKMLVSQLENQQFDETMRIKQNTLAERGFERDSEQQILDNDHRRFQESISKDQLGISQANLQENIKNGTLNRANAVSQENRLKTEEDRAAKRFEAEKLRVESNIDDSLYQISTQTIDINQGLGTDRYLLQDPEYLDRANQILRNEGIEGTLGEDGIVRDENGKEIPMMVRDQSNLRIKLYGEADRMSDTPAKALRQADNAALKIQSVQKQMNSLSNSPHVQHEKAGYKVQINKLKSEIRKMQSIASPMGIINWHSNKAEALENRGRQFLNRKDTDQANQFFDEASAHRDAARLGLAALNKAKAKAAEGDSSTVKGEFTENNMINYSKNRHSKPNMMGVLVLESAQKPFTQASSEAAMVKYKGSNKLPQARIDSAVEAETELITMRDNYWKDDDNFIAMSKETGGKALLNEQLREMIQYQVDNSNTKEEDILTVGRYRSLMKGPVSKLLAEVQRQNKNTFKLLQRVKLGISNPFIPNNIMKTTVGVGKVE